MTTIKPGWTGRFFEDFSPGDVYRSRLGRTVTEFDNINFTLLTNNTNQIHYNRDYGEKSGFGGCLVNSALTLAIVTGLSVEDVSENGVNLGWDGIKLPNPVHPGDTLYSETEVLGVRESQSRPAQGIVNIATRGYNQHGTLVIEFTRTILVWKRDQAPVNDLFPTVQA